ncbi:hypothetical protein PoB_003705500 [Plakobranchus ocellatus]|uniref:BESS domain-containing protein n=1 Tax=Plakobranchus ocellatus TaxID=259542 RepID=A0AAV4ATB4_9GAST|nr:hypothetical protein PoB_003705500 [Plakobranchus ocellatus]
MDFLRSHLHYHRTASSSLVRQPPAAAVESLSWSPEPETARDTSEQVSETSGPVSRSSSPRSTVERDTGTFNSAAKARKRDSTSELDSAMISFINRASVRNEEPEDPAVGWFKSLLPMYNSLSPIEKLDFQSTVVLELKKLMLAKEQRMANQSVPSTSTNAQHQHYSASPDTPAMHQYNYYQKF